MNDDPKHRALVLGLHGLLARWDELTPEEHEVVMRLLAWEEAERQRRSLERRLRNARVGRFKSIADYDWKWPKRCDREAIEDLLALRFVEERANAIVLGPNGVGKTMLSRNIAHAALLAGYTVRFATASEMLNDLAAQDGAQALGRRLRHYAQPTLLVIDELGYLSYSNRHADLLFEVVSRRYGERSTLITTNKPFAEWSEVFPNASCVVTLVDRLVHHCDIVQIEGESYRLKEARERQARRPGGRTRRATERADG
jgi:DNA replication protein DnaC